MASPLRAEVVAASSLRFGNVALDGDDIYWIEGRPSERGRSVVVRRAADGTIADATPAGTNVRTRVHEFGGAPFVVAGGVIYFSECSDQRLYRLTPGEAAEPMTPAGPWRYADASIDRRRKRLICVREEHAEKSSGEVSVVSTLVSIPLDGPLTAGDVVASGEDFYSTPRFSPDGSRLAWLAWRHPQMPWDGTELWLARVHPDGGITDPRVVAGGSSEAIVQPGWSPDGTLHFVSDRTGWWNLYRLRGDAIEPVRPVDADCGRPPWTFGTATWGFSGEALVVAEAHGGRWTLSAGAASGWEPGEYLEANDRHVVFVGGSSTSPDAVVRLDMRTNRAEILRTAGAALDPHDVSVAEAMEFPTADRLTAHAFYYSPFRDGRSGATRPPPLIVTCHGGPTSATHARLNLEIQYWTSRGFAVADVNYRGSTGFGREYRRSLNGKWGVADVEDCLNAARFLAAKRFADATRLVIRGRSAGGFTVLGALTQCPEVFAAGAIYYGVADLERLAHDTHKFEERYLDRLIGPYPEARSLYRQRSPINHIDRLQCPLVVFQGLDDTVVPPAQSEAIVAAVRSKGLAVEYFAFPGESHGFRRAETIVRCLEAEAAFYQRATASI